MAMIEYADIDHYISDQADETVKAKLQKIRETIRLAAPDAIEVISYGMPAFKQNGILVYFAAFKNHLSLFPASLGVAIFGDRLASYKTSKGTIQFSHKQEIPFDLITEIVKFRAMENNEKAALKKNKEVTSKRLKQ